MIIFANLGEAQKNGFHWLEYQPHLGLHLVEVIQVRRDGLKVRALAFCRP
jgi:hypothetical protein